MKIQKTAKVVVKAVVIQKIVVQIVQIVKVVVKAVMNEKTNYFFLINETLKLRNKIKVTRIRKTRIIRINF